MGNSPTDVKNVPKTHVALVDNKPPAAPPPYPPSRNTHRFTQPPLSPAISTGYVDSCAENGPFSTPGRTARGARPAAPRKHILAPTPGTKTTTTIGIVTTPMQLCEGVGTTEASWKPGMGTSHLVGHQRGKSHEQQQRRRISGSVQGTRWRTGPEPVGLRPSQVVAPRGAEKKVA